MRKLLRQRLPSAMFLLSMVAVPAAAAPAYRFNTVDVPFAGATETELFEITDAGDSVGSYVDAAGARHGFLLQNGTYTSISAPGANATRILGMNSAGQMVGFYRTAADPGSQHAFLRQADGTFETIDHPGQDFNYAFRINDAGQVGGYYFEFPSTPSGIFITSHLREPDGSFVPRLFSTEGDGTVLRGLNNDGTQAGWWLAPDGGIHGIVGVNGVFAEFDVPGAAFTLPNDINDAGIVAGFAADPTFEGQGFIRLADGTFALLAVPGAHSTEVLGINNLGQLVGSYEDEQGNVHGFIAHIPEPGSLWLLACALLLGGRRLVAKR